jgi:hypothetical protein
MDVVKGCVQSIRMQLAMVSELIVQLDVAHNFGTYREILLCGGHKPEWI